MTMTYEEWVERYEPLEDSLGDTMTFETYGTDLGLVKGSVKEHVWTLIESGAESKNGHFKEYVVAGFHYVNRMKYLLTRLPWETGTEEAEW